TLAAGELTSLGSALLRETGSADDLLRIARVRVVPRRVPDHLLGGQLGDVVGRLRHDADSRAPRPVAILRVDAEDRHVAGVPLPVALEDLDGRGLAGAVRPEQR